MLKRLRSIKTDREIDCIRGACEIAASAFAEGAKRLVPGLTEHQAAELFHQGVCEPRSATGSNRVGGFTWCMSGPNSAQACAAFARSTARVLERGDLALVHCNSYSGGFWTDITRTYCLGPVDERAQRLYDAVFAARAAALDAIRPGIKSAAVDEAARRVLGNYGWKEEFKHSAGHGVGFGAIDPQALPRLHPKSSDILQPGMVFNLEPALYFAGYGGLRHCDMVALTSSGPEVLTRFQESGEKLAIS
jgi:Xaa-Pro aminopeptidase